MVQLHLKGHEPQTCMAQHRREHLVSGVLCEQKAATAGTQAPYLPIKVTRFLAPATTAQSEKRPGKLNTEQTCPGTSVFPSLGSLHSGVLTTPAWCWASFVEDLGLRCCAHTSQPCYPFYSTQEETEAEEVDTAV